jgi:hypothetical protein
MENYTGNQTGPVFKDIDIGDENMTAFLTAVQKEWLVPEDGKLLPDGCATIFDLSNGLTLMLYNEKAEGIEDNNFINLEQALNIIDDNLRPNGIILVSSEISGLGRALKKDSGLQSVLTRRDVILLLSALEKLIYR